ncbi:MAG: tryptophan synthase subunit alpha [Candidatus Omnitrophica bacterium]|nr:tryptophan synthase subunit alpha [Candidatus Omnitrophota bacterium]MDD5351989.1 tryptophan synthase subunit alpha [Candidatus Omnitrophota bacterium]MDD5551043.1 tryptophan synthase subunit alpha [Candidatus Omnitrophota bacterium]
MNRITKKFTELKKKNKKALVVYLTVGYPDIATTEKLILELARIGVHMFELGVPFSDPLADGPVIQASSSYALKHKINLDNTFSLTKRLRKKIDNPLLIMGYFNPVLNYGLERFAKNAGLCGLDGIIIPDLPTEEARALRSYLDKNKLYLIDFIAPTTDSSRIKKIAKECRGFIYYVSLTGVTGARNKLPRGISERLAYLKRFIKIPVCVGFGISNRKQFQSIAKFSDGVIVGSAIIKNIRDNLGKKDLVHKVVSFTKKLVP